MLYLHMRDVCKSVLSFIVVVGEYILPDIRHCDVTYL